MQDVLIVIHLMVVIALIIVVLLQRSEGGALGMGGGGSGGLMSARSAANALTRLTAILATAFIAISLWLAILATQSDRPADLLNELLPASSSGNGEGDDTQQNLLDVLKRQNDQPQIPQGPQVPVSE